jgi:cell division protein ZapA (FtsZ GTPase activity inhibitor)
VKATDKKRSDKKLELEIQLLDQRFPIRIDASEESDVLASVQQIESILSQYKMQFPHKTDLYRVLMCCLHLATENSVLQTKLAQIQQSAQVQLQQLDQLLAEVLAETAI